MSLLQPQPSVNDVRGSAMAQLVARLDALDLTPILVYRIDSVPDAALPFLAWQFDILGPLWSAIATASETSEDLDFELETDVPGLASWPDAGAGISTAGSGVTSSSTSLALRGLIKNAIQLHRWRGTPFAITNALGLLGFPAASLLEGQSSWGGTAYPSSQGWAVFRVNIPVAPGAIPTTAQLTSINAVINFFKNARSWLDSVWLVWPQLLDSFGPMTDSVGPADHLSMSDVLTVALMPLTDTLGAPAEYRADLKYGDGFTYANQPIGITDGPITVNGVPEE